MEEVSTSNESLDDETSNKLLTLRLPKVLTTRVGVTSNCMEQMTPLEKMGPSTLKEDPENEDDY